MINQLKPIYAIHDIYKIVCKFREGGDIELFITLVPKVLKYRFFIRWFDDFGNFH